MVSCIKKPEIWNRMFSGTERMCSDIIGFVTAMFKDPSHAVEKAPKWTINLLYFPI